MKTTHHAGDPIPADWYTQSKWHSDRDSFIPAAGSFGVDCEAEVMDGVRHIHALELGYTFHFRGGYNSFIKFDPDFKLFSELGGEFSGTHKCEGEDTAIADVWLTPDTKTEIVSPMEWFLNNMDLFKPVVTPERMAHITHDPNVDYEYRIIREQSHDGTSSFTHELIAKILMLLLNKATSAVQSYPTAPVKDIHYTIGNLRIDRNYGPVKLSFGTYPGVTEVISLPVRCKYILF